MQFYCSKAAVEALERTTKGQRESWLDTAPVPEAAGPWVWQVHAIKLLRQNVFIVMERGTRFAMVFWGIKKGDGETLLQQFYERLVNLLLWLNQEVKGLSEADADAAVEHLMVREKRFCFVAGADRSTQTHINDVAGACAEAVDEIGYFPEDSEQAAGFDTSINDTLLSIRGGEFFSPDEAFFCSWAREYANASEKQCTVLKDSFRQRQRNKMARLMTEHAGPDNPVLEDILAILQGRKLQ